MRIYVAGPLTPKCKITNPAIEYLGNVKNMINICKDLLLLGYYPYCPALDYHFFLHLNESEVITNDMIKEYSFAWLEVCEVVYVLPGWKTSEGTLAEIEFAKKHNKKIIYGLSDLMNMEMGI